MTFDPAEQIARDFYDACERLRAAEWPELPPLTWGQAHSRTKELAIAAFRELLDTEKIYVP